MYIEHFGLARPLLDDGIACDDRIYVGPAQRAAQADLELALNRGDAVVVIEGPAGTGKSTLAASALRDAATQLAIGCLTDPAETAHELLEQLLTEFGFSPYRLSRTERHTHWRQYLSEMAATGSRVGIVVEATDRLGARVLAELERLTSADIRGSAGATVLLTASRPLTALLEDDRLASLRQRCRAVIRVAPLTAEETLHYLEFRFQGAGGRWDAIGTPEVAARLHEISGGIFRVIDNVLESCLARAARDGETRLSVDLLDRVAAQLPGSVAAATANTIGTATGDAGSAPVIEPNRSGAYVPAGADAEADDSDVAIGVAEAPDHGDIVADAAVPMDDGEVALDNGEAPAGSDVTVDVVAAPIADDVTAAASISAGVSPEPPAKADTSAQSAPPAPSPEPEPIGIAAREAPAPKPDFAVAGLDGAKPRSGDPATQLRSESPADRPDAADSGLDLGDLGVEISLSALTELTLEPDGPAGGANVAPPLAATRPAAAPHGSVGADRPEPPELSATDALDPAAIEPVDPDVSPEPAATAAAGPQQTVSGEAVARSAAPPNEAVEAPVTRPAEVPAAPAAASADDRERPGNAPADVPDLPELNLDDAVDLPADAAFDIPVLDDIVPVETLTGADDPIDEDVVEALLSLSGAAMSSQATPASAAAPEVDAEDEPVDPEIDGDPGSVELVETDLEDADGLSDEDRRQIEMLEAFANADALEQISESMAETIFGDAYAESISADIKASYDSLSKAREDDRADEETGDASPGPGVAAGR